MKNESESENIVTRLNIEAGRKRKEIKRKERKRKEKEKMVKKGKKERKR